MTKNIDSRTSPPAPLLGGEGSGVNEKSGKEKKVRNFYYNKSRAKLLRHKETKAEKILWKRIRNRQVNNLKFRRQHPIGYYIADFYCFEKDLIIELEGGVHEINEQKEYDQIRRQIIEDWFYNIIYFKNEEIYFDLEKVIEKIIKISNEIESPLSWQERGRG